jgi:hypothetical protein
LEVMANVAPHGYRFVFAEFHDMRVEQMVLRNWSCRLEGRLTCFLVEDEDDDERSYICRGVLTFVDLSRISVQGLPGAMSDEYVSIGRLQDATGRAGEGIDDWALNDMVGPIHAEFFFAGSGAVLSAEFMKLRFEILEVCGRAGNE